MKKFNRVIAFLLTACMALSLICNGAFAVSFTEKPDDGVTVGQPFAPGTGGSDNFRIPGIVTLNDGTLIAACDARWNHAGDGAGLDTIVSVSKDNGATWTYTFANYLGDNGNVYNNLSTCFIDPGIGTDGTTAYLIADLWPAGIALNTSKYSPVAGENGFDDNGNLLLRDISKDTVRIGLSGYNTMAAKAKYGYYLDLDELKLYAYGENGADVPVEGYTVDAYFNIVSDDGSVNTNLFCADSPYQPYPTDYLYLTTSTDGLNWSTPQLLNLKEEKEQTLLVGPGNGTYDPVHDRMIFTAYEHTSGYERACLIWRDANGNWTRTEDATVDSWSSEATSVVLEDGTVRMFYRDGSTALRYTDYVWSESQQNYVRDPECTEVTTAAVVDYGCQLTSIKYSQKVDGKELILVAGPTSYRRINGYIYGFLVDADNSMELVYAYNVTPDFYAYSCLTELKNGDIGLLYESAGSALTFVTYPKDEIIHRDNDVRYRFEDIHLLTGDSITLKDNTGYHTAYDSAELNSAIAGLQISGNASTVIAGQLGNDASYSGNVVELSACAYTLTKQGDVWSAVARDTDGNTVYLYPGNTTGSGYPNRDSAYANLSIHTGYQDGTFCIVSNDCDSATMTASYLYFDPNNLRWDRVSTPGTNTNWQKNVSLYLYQQVAGEGSEEIPGYEKVTTLEQVADGNYLVVAKGNDGNLYALYPNISKENRFCQIAKVIGATTIGYTDLTFTGVGIGYTEVLVGSTVYRITVTEYNDIPITVPVGDMVTLTDPVADYSGSNMDEVDAQLAEVALQGNSETGSTSIRITGRYPGTTELILGRNRYVITVAGDVIQSSICVDEQLHYVTPNQNGLAAVDSPQVNVTSAAASLGYMTSRGYFDLKDCLYTFNLNKDGTWVISAVTADGTVVYLNHSGSTNANQPNTANASDITIRKGSIRDMFKLTSGNRTLHFHAEATEPYWDRCSSDSTYKCQEYIYRPVREGETSSREIIGFVRVTAVNELKDGEQYLIAACTDAGQWYVLNPGIGDKENHLAKVVDGYCLTITGLTPGETTFCVGSVIFELTVQEHPQIEERIENEIQQTETQDGSYDRVELCTHCGKEITRTTVTVPATGTPNEPQKPTEPDQPETPEEPEKPGDSEAPKDTVDPTEPEAPAPVVPKDQNYTVFVVIAVVLVIGVAAMLILLKKKK